MIDYTKRLLLIVGFAAP